MENEKIVTYGGESLGGSETVTGTTGGFGTETTMQTGSTIEVPSNGGTLTFEVKSEPYPPRILCTNPSWVTEYDSSDGTLTLKIGEIKSDEGRLGELTIDASTTADSSYNGIDVVSCAYTITQSGGGGKTLTFKPVTINITNKSTYVNQLNVTVTMYFTTEINTTEEQSGNVLTDDLLGLMLRNGFEMRMKDNSFVICYMEVLLNDSIGDMSGFKWDNMFCRVESFTPNPEGESDVFNVYNGFDYVMGTRGYVSRLSIPIYKSYPSSATTNNVQSLTIKLEISGGGI